MSDFNDMVYQSLIKPESLIKGIISPLQRRLNISRFGYVSIDKNGALCSISNCIEPLDFFYEEKLYFNYPYFKDPEIFRTGWSVIPMTQDKEYYQRVRNVFRVDHMLLLLKQNGNQMDQYYFSCENLSAVDCLHFIDHLHLLENFSSYFKREAATLIQRILAEGYNAKKVLGKAFYQVDPTVKLLKNDVSAQAFLREISPLSMREQQCIELYRRGYSAQSTGATLGLSQRTVENYFERIKNKLGLHSKRELLDQ